jgi:hypothetical protein
MDLDGPNLTERCHELHYPFPIGCLEDDVERVGIVNHRLGLNVDALACCVSRGEVTEEHIPHLRIGSRAVLRSVGMLRNEKRHDCPPCRLEYIVANG